MTRNTNPASPTKPLSPSRAWRAIAALLFSVLLAPTAAFADATAPATPAAAQQNATTPPAPAAAPAAAPVATDPAQAAAPAPADDSGVVLEEDNSLGMAHDLSPWGMYQNADVVVKAVMIQVRVLGLRVWKDDHPFLFSQVRPA